MTDKERLEEIKNKWSNTKILYSEDINWLIKQTERVQELEEVLLQNKYDKALYEKKVIEWLELKEENKRYRKAINNIIEKAMLFGTSEEVYEAIQDAIQALEGTE